jgi:hypothetical protein
VLIFSQTKAQAEAYASAFCMSIAILLPCKTAISAVLAAGAPAISVRGGLLSTV